MNDTKFSTRRRIWGGTMRGLMVLCAGLTCALALFLILYVLIKGVPHLSWELLSTKPSYLSDTIGILPDIISTVCMVLTTLLIVLPVGVCAAVYLTEYAGNRKLVAVIEYAAETLSGIPSIIYGLVGQMFFCQFLGMKKSLIACEPRRTFDITTESIIAVKFFIRIFVRSEHRPIFCTVNFLRYDDNLSFYVIIHSSLFK